MTQTLKTVESHADVPIADIATADIERWLQAVNDPCATTHTNRLRYLSVFFNYAKAQGWVTDNPVTRLPQPKQRRSMPEFLPVAAVRKVFLSASPEAIPRLALGFFAGIRSSELNGVCWSDIKWSDKIITIRPEVAKTGVTRHVTLAANCLAWLRLHMTDLPTMCVSQRRLSTLVDTSHWPRNCMRHTFCTNHMAMYQNPGRTAFELGHRQDPSLLYRHYRGLVRKSDAEEYWEIRPKKQLEVIEVPA